MRGRGKESNNTVEQSLQKKLDKKTKKSKKDNTYTASQKAVEETKFCKDCKFYRKTVCKIKSSHTPRKQTCEEWGKK